MSTGHKGYGHYFKKRSIRALMVLLGIIVLIAAAVLVTLLVVIPSIRYNHAIRAMEDGQYDEAIVRFTALDDFRDSLENTIVCIEKRDGLESALFPFSLQSL